MSSEQMQSRSEADHSGSAIFERLLAAYGAHGVSELAEAMGEKLPTVKGWKQRESIPLDRCVQAWRDTGRSLDWIVLGLNQLQIQSASLSAAGPGRHLGVDCIVAEQSAPWRVSAVEAKAPQSGGSRDNTGGPPDAPAALLRQRGAGAVLPLVLSLPLGEQGGRSKDYQVIPTHVRTAAAGKGKEQSSSTADQLNLAGDIAFGFDWMRQNFGHTSGQLTAIQVRGDSMATTLLDGDTIIIDEGVSDVEVDGIYVFDFYGRRLVKRLQQLSDGSLLLISDNQNYQRETVPRDRARDIRVVGRMVWPRTR